MGYDTESHGSFKPDKPLSEDHATYLKHFADTRHMQLDATNVDVLDDPVRVAVGLPIGPYGEYFVGDIPPGDEASVILSINDHPPTQPGLWCMWVPSNGRQGIECDGVNTFYYYIDWLKQHFLGPWGYILNGSVYWRGEHFNDMGVIEVTDNVVTTRDLRSNENFYVI